MFLIYENNILYRIFYIFATQEAHDVTMKV